MRGSLAIKGARFDSRNPTGAGDQLMLNGRGPVDKILPRSMTNMLADERESFALRASSPSPSVASLMAAQGDLQVGQHSNPSGSKMLAQALVGADAGTAAVAAAMARQNQGSSLLTENNTSKLKNSILDSARPGPAVTKQPSAAGDKTSSSSTTHKVKEGISNGRYWSAPIEHQTVEDVLVIHVCDENRQISKDFCCKRDILVAHMKYFEKFLKENEAGYDDIDISVHCDVEIFEWLMTYIHEPDKPPQLEKAIVVSILISSDFLQMDKLVEHCLVHISNNLNETIRLPIDLSCISDKIINRLALMTHPKTLAHTKDRKDKILNKLYKRRVELDFSRKSGARGGIRTIAASLTCCRYCGIVYLDNWVSMLHCTASPLAIDFRGKLTKRHSAIPAWSLTSYLKNLHVSGMNWDSIYWHVWASCQVFRVSDFVISVIEVDRYKIEPDGLLIDAPVITNGDVISGSDRVVTMAPGTDPSSSTTPSAEGKDSSAPLFSLGDGDLSRNNTVKKFKVHLTPYDVKPAYSQITCTLNPSRPPHILPPQIYELICTQTKYLTSTTNKGLIDKAAQQMLQASAIHDLKPFNFQQALWGDFDEGVIAEYEERLRGRSRSPNTGRKKALDKGGAMLASKSQTRGIGGTSSAQGDAKRGKISGGKEIKGSRNSGQQEDSKEGSLDRAPSVDSNNSDAAGSGSDLEASKNGGERRSRSMGAVALRANNAKGKDSKKNPIPSGGGANANGVTIRRIIVNPGDDGYRSILGSDPMVGQHLAMYKTIPPEVVRRVHLSKGNVKGVWLQPHPLQLHPVKFADSFNYAKDRSELTSAKRFEWQMDIIREYDEKRCDKIETFLSQRRNSMESLARSGSVTSAINMLKNNGSSSSTNSKSVKELYYRDKGRQPHL
jgi:hypothetical protein